MSVKCRSLVSIVTRPWVPLVHMIPIFNKISQKEEVFYLNKTLLLVFNFSQLFSKQFLILWCKEMLTTSLPRLFLPLTVRQRRVFMDTIATGRSHSFASPWHCQNLLHQLNGFWRLALNVQISQKEDIPLMKATLIMRHVTILL